MRFVCDRCKSKYSISDEKVRGKILKIRCKRCDHIIEVRDPGASRSLRTGAPVRTPAPSRPPDEMPAEHTQISSPGLLDELRRTAANLALQPSSEPQLADWYVAIDDRPEGPLNREQIRGHLAAGRVTSESLVWREGFDDWRTLGETRELRDLLRGSRALAAPAAPPRPSAAARAVSRRPDSGLADVIPLRPPAEAPPAEPRQREERAERGSGLEQIPAALSPPPPAQPSVPSPSGRVAVPLRGREVGRLGARPAGLVASPVAALPSLAQAPEAPPSRAPTPPPPPPEAYGARGPAPAAPSARGGAEAGAPAPPEPGEVSLAALVSAPPPSFQAADSEGSELFPIAALPAAARASASELRQPSPSLVPAVQAATAGRRRAALLLAVLGAVLVGVVGAVVAVKLLGGQPTADAAEPERTTLAQNLVEPPPPPSEHGLAAIEGLRGTVEDERGQADAGTTLQLAGLKGTKTAAKSNGSPREKTLSAEEQRLLEQARSLGAGEGGPVVARTKAEGGGEAAGLVRGGEPLSPAQVRTTVGKNMSSIQRCYEREMRGARMERDLRVLVYMRIGTSGTVRTTAIRTAQVKGTALGECIETAIRRWRFPNATGETEVETPFVLTPRQ